MKRVRRPPLKSPKVSLLRNLQRKKLNEAISNQILMEAFQTKKRGNLGNGPNRGRGVVKKVPSSRGYQRLIK